jgi:IS5 family transposase
MRDVRAPQLGLDFNPMDPELEEKFEVMGKILKNTRRELDLVLADLTDADNLATGRTGMSADQVLRMILVKQMYAYSYEQLHARVSDSICLRRFCGYEFARVPKPQTLQENIAKLSPETLEAIHKALVRYAKKEGIDSGTKVRIDTLAVETNIHHPTDSSLIEDGVRVLTRMLRSARRVFPEARIAFHDRTRVVKKRTFAVVNAKRTEDRVRLYRELVQYAEEVLGYAREGTRKLKGLGGTEDVREAARAAAGDIKQMADLLARVIDQTQRRVFKGESVPADEKVVSLFEFHTDIIEKGGRETVFGHKVCVSVGKGNLVLDAIVERGNPADTEFFPEALDRHRHFYGRAPETVAADGGFASQYNARYAKAQGAEHVSFTKRVGRTLRDLLPDRAMRRLLYRFRAGVEGIVSALKRGVGLGRCPWRGWESFEAYVWSSLAAHNLKMLTETIWKRQRRRTARA